MNSIKKFNLDLETKMNSIERFNWDLESKMNTILESLNKYNSYYDRKLLKKKEKKT